MHHLSYPFCLSFLLQTNQHSLQTTGYNFSLYNYRYNNSTLVTLNKLMMNGETKMFYKLIFSYQNIRQLIICHFDLLGAKIKINFMYCIVLKVISSISLFNVNRELNPKRTTPYLPHWGSVGRFPDTKRHLVIWKFCLFPLVGFPSWRQLLIMLIRPLPWLGFEVFRKLNINRKIWKFTKMNFGKFRI